MNDEALTASVESLRNIFAIVLALSLSEAFKQFVADRADNPQTDKQSIRWDSIIALASFLLLLIPFYHGMARYLHDVYKIAPRPDPYGAYLLYDVFAFTVEASLFFVMSRALRLEQWRRFYGAVVLILVADTLWGVPVYLLHRPELQNWLWLNIIFLPLFAALLLIFRGTDSRWGPCLAFAAIALRTVLDYATSWPFYFPVV